MIDLEKRYLDEVVAILQKHAPELEVRAFGSRVSGRARKFSDLDLVLLGTDKLPPRRIENIKDAFSESDLPILVDVVDWHAVTDTFRAVIDQKHETVQKARPSLK
jgi:uncharacterized protein